MNDATRTRIAAGLTVIFLAAVSTAGLATRGGDDPGASAAGSASPQVAAAASEAVATTPEPGNALGQGAYEDDEGYELGYEDDGDEAGDDD